MENCWGSGVFEPFCFSVSVSEVVCFGKAQPCRMNMLVVREFGSFRL